MSDFTLKHMERFTNTIGTRVSTAPDSQATSCFLCQYAAWNSPQIDDPESAKKGGQHVWAAHRHQYEALLEADRPLVEAGIARDVKPLHLGGFTRSSAG